MKKIELYYKIQYMIIVTGCNAFVVLLFNSSLVRNIFARLWLPSLILFVPFSLFFPSFSHSSVAGFNEQLIVLIACQIRYIWRGHGERSGEIGHSSISFVFLFSCSSKSVYVEELHSNTWSENH